MNRSTTRPAAHAKGADESLTHDDIIRIIGDLEDAKVSEIMAMAPTAEELDEAVAWAEAEDDVMGDQRRSLSGTAARIYEILITRKEQGDEER